MRSKHEISEAILKSWETRDSSVNELSLIIDWINKLNENTKVNLEKISISECADWFYDNEKGVIRNTKNTFFQIAGLVNTVDGEVISEQPIILQDEIGFLGIICTMKNGVLHFLMQAKIEPGNINKIQLSPTLQATKSNFTQQHGGRKPNYLDYFSNAKNYTILYDQIQSEQSSRFLGKRNRNIVIFIEDEIEETKNFKWMTLGQIKELMKYDNLINMDTRTVLSGLPIFHITPKAENQWNNQLSLSINGNCESQLPKIMNYMNDYKMFDTTERKIVSLGKLKNWQWIDNDYKNLVDYHFKVIFANIEIEDREVKRWGQPLFEAEGKALFLLVCKYSEHGIRFLVHAIPEVGTFDKIEVGPTLQLECGNERKMNDIDKYIYEKYSNGDGVRSNVILSEEGGRFYHEENNNVILLVDDFKFDESELNKNGYFWCDYYTLIRLMQINNVLNIQLRNLMSIIDWEK